MRNGTRERDTPADSAGLCLLSVFGLGLMFTGIFHHAPIIAGITYNSIEDNLHSIFASIVGLSFTVYALIYHCHFSDSLARICPKGPILIGLFAIFRVKFIVFGIFPHCEIKGRVS